MSTPKTCFQFEDLFEELPPPGYYRSSIHSARFRRSANGNRMLQVVYSLDAVWPAHQLVTDYFVLEGASPSGVLLGRRRLVQLYRACGLEPKEGGEIVPAELVQARLEVRVEHEQWEGQPRLRVVAYRPLPSDEHDVPF